MKGSEAYFVNLTKNLKNKYNPEVLEKKIRKYGEIVAKEIIDRVIELPVEQGKPISAFYLSEFLRKEFLGKIKKDNYKQQNELCPWCKKPIGIVIKK